jgi:hypothetical protein
MHTKRFRGDEEVFVQAEPFRTLSKQISERPPLSTLIFGTPPQDGLENTEQRIHSLALHVKDKCASRQLTNSKEDDIFARTEPLWCGSDLWG